MATDYGTDIQALDDLPDPEIIVSGDLNVAYALARRLCQPAGTMVLIGDNAPADTIDVRQWMGQRFSLFDRSVVDDLQQQARSVLLQDERVSTVAVTVTFASGLLSIAVAGEGADGPFSLVITTDGVTAQLLAGGQ